MTSEIHPLRVLLKALVLFGLFNIVYAMVHPRVSEISGYNVVFPGRSRLPFGVMGDPYTVTVEDVDTMFASHQVHAPRKADEYRVVLIGDSSVWGEGLAAHEVISEQWNAMHLGCGTQTIRFYNLGYPHPSVMKDLLILDKALEYEPDHIIWFVTLNSLISQRLNPFLLANRTRLTSLLEAHEIAFKAGERLEESRPGFYERTLIGQRSRLARSIKLQMLGLIWTATGADTNRAAGEEPADFEIEDDPVYRGMQPPSDLTDQLLFSALSAGQARAGPIPVLIVNEPIYIGTRAETTVRYNAGYPRWAYDQYRTALAAEAQRSGWSYLDLWKAIPRRYFLDAGLHLGAAGERQLIEEITPTLVRSCTPSP